MKEEKQHQIFEDWLGKHKGLLFKVIHAYANNPEDTNDLFQEVCLQLYRSIPSFKGKSATTTWIYRIALNTSIKWSSKEKRLQNSSNVDGLKLIEPSNEILDNRISWLYKEIKQLNEIDRSILLLLLEDISYKEMAEILGISESNIGVKIHRIKKTLKEKSNKVGNYEL